MLWHTDMAAMASPLKKKSSGHTHLVGTVSSHKWPPLHPALWNLYSHRCFHHPWHSYHFPDACPVPRPCWYSHEYRRTGPERSEYTHPAIWHKCGYQAMVRSIYLGIAWARDNRGGEVHQVVLVRKKMDCCKLWQCSLSLYTPNSVDSNKFIICKNSFLKSSTWRVWSYPSRGTCWNWVSRGNKKHSCIEWNPCTESLHEQKRHDPPQTVLWASCSSSSPEPGHKCL